MAEQSALLAQAATHAPPTQNGRAAEVQSVAI
jgi:hypothetical protein